MAEALWHVSLPLLGAGALGFMYVTAGDGWGRIAALWCRLTHRWGWPVRGYATCLVCQRKVKVEW